MIEYTPTMPTTEQQQRYLHHTLAYLYTVNYNHETSNIPFKCVDGWTVDDETKQIMHNINKSYEQLLKYCRNHINNLDDLNSKLRRDEELMD